MSPDLRGLTMETPKRLLVIGDLPIVESIKDRLFVEGFEAVFCTDATCARQHVDQFGMPHLMLVKVNLPQSNGLAVCEEMHALADPPIIVMAEEDPPRQAAQALRYADDYVRLPVDPAELIMRIRRILSRIDNFSYASGPTVKICDELELDVTQRTVIVNGDKRQLTPTESALLQVLIKHWGKVVDADTLIARVWHSSTSSIQDRNSLRVHMHRLRHKIERDPGDPRVIQTERGIGYVFVGC